eukprot:g35234.t1
MVEKLNRDFASVFAVEYTSSIPELQQSQGRSEVVAIIKEKVLGKLKESIIKDEIVEYLEVLGKIGLSQYGFIKGRSCLTNLFKVFEE